MRIARPGSGRLGIGRGGQLARGASVDGEGVYATRQQCGEGMIHEAMSRHPRAAGEALADDAHREVPPFASAGVARVQMAVVAHLELARCERRTKRRLDLGRADPAGVQGLPAGASPAPSSCRWRLR